LEITFILVNPGVPENIGASARAIKTMGFNKLTLINPPEGYLVKARILAHGSADILEKAEIYSSFKSAISGYDYLIATSSKKRRTNEEHVQADELPELILLKKAHLKRIAIVFGGEESGLSNTEIKQCDLISSIPLASPYPSLNLSQAVMIFAYILSGLESSRNQTSSGPQEASLKVLKEKITGILKNIPLKQPHIIGPRIMEKISLMKDDDLNLLHSICNAYLEERRRE
jgi:tRNA/rRNA methyltransferase